MSEQIHDQVSAFVDDELSAEECAFLVRRLERDPDARNKLIRYSLMGSVLRRELMQPDPQMLRRRVNEALSGAAPQTRPAAVAHAASPSSSGRWANPAFGLGIAATVAVAALFTIRTANQVGSDGDVAGALQTNASAAASSYVVPASPQDSLVVTPPPIRLTNYLMRHGEYASRLSRTSVHSSVVGAVGTAPLLVEAVVVDDAPAATQSDERGVQ